MRKVFVRALAAVSLAAALSITTGCHHGHSAGARAHGRIEFGIWVDETDQDEGRFVATPVVPYVEEQAFGWRLQNPTPNRPVKWVETIRLPAVPESWEGLEESPNVTLSEDGRTATTMGQSEPGDEFIGNEWYVSPGDPLGDYEITVEVEDGTRATYKFHVVLPKDGRAPATGGEIV
ncbi:MAG TPA: hypothetical protein VMT50_04595 [Steroidobacteraceae bacterium]|nr:hypothetical protein [Steroidobacteraceae bacterium]